MPNSSISKQQHIYTIILIRFHWSSNRFWYRWNYRFFNIIKKSFKSWNSSNR